MVSWCMYSYPAFVLLGGRHQGVEREYRFQQYACSSENVSREGSRALSAQNEKLHTPCRSLHWLRLAYCHVLDSQRPFLFGQQFPLFRVCSGFREQGTQSGFFSLPLWIGGRAVQPPLVAFCRTVATPFFKQDGYSRTALGSCQMLEIFAMLEFRLKRKLK